MSGASATQQTPSQKRQPVGPVAYVAGIGMITSVGVNSDMTLASVQAGISQYSVSEFMTPDEEEITMASIPEEFYMNMEIEIDKGRVYGEQFEHIIKMAVVAIQEAISDQEISDPIPLILAMPEPNDEADHIPSELLVKNLIKQQLPINVELVRSIHTGRAAGIQSLELAFRYLFEAGHEFVLIGGSDSFLSYPRLDSLDGERLKTESSMDSFVPGEGAGFLLLGRSVNAAMSDGEHVVALYPPGVAEEPGYIRSDDDYLGEGLDQAFKQALGCHLGPAIQTIYSSMNGEHYWSKEYGVALIRNKDHFNENYNVVHPAEYFGDLGAATGSVMLGLAAKSLLDRRDSTNNLIYSSSDSSWRAAVKMEKQNIISTLENK